MSTFQNPRLCLSFAHRFGSIVLGLAALAAASPSLCAPIHDAARAGDLDKVKALVKANPDVVASKDEKYGQTPLHIAAFNDRKEVAEFLLANKADVNAKSKNGSTPLHLAAGKGNKDIVEVLLANKAEIDAVDNEGWSPVHSAVFFNQKETEDLLIAKGGKELPAPPKPATPTAKNPADKAPPLVTGSEGRFNVYDNGTVVDTKSNLMWMARDNGAPLSWPNAKKYATDSRNGDFTDWRLPTLAELAALYESDKTHRSFCPTAVDEMGAAADEVHMTTLIHLTCTRIWTSDERKDKAGFATIFDFHTGKDAARPEDEKFADLGSRVLLVRHVK